MDDPLATSLDPLVRDLIEWCAREPRTTSEVLEAWRTSCPRLTVWEDAIERGFLARGAGPRDPLSVTTAGRAFFAQRR